MQPISDLGRILLACVIGLALTIVVARADNPFGRSDFGSKSQFPCADGCGDGGRGTNPETVPIPPKKSPTPAEIEQQRREENAAHLNMEGVRLFNDGDYRNAISTLRRALLDSPQDRMIARNLAHAEAEQAFKDGNLPAAIEHIQSAIDLGRSDLGDRLAYFRREQIARHDAQLTAAYRGVLDRDRQWEPPTPMLEHSSRTAWESIKQSIKGHAQSFLQDVVTEGPGKGHFDAVDTAAEGGGIFKRYVVRLFSNFTGAVKGFFRGDVEAVSRYDQSNRELGRALQSDVRQFTGEQLSGTAGETSKDLLLHKFGK
jgi:tetratricopeptide (TPR) repeat protein